MSEIEQKPKRTRKPKVWDTKRESERYDAAFYDKHTKYYERGLENYRNFLIEICNATSIADVGCGQGDWVAPLQDKMPVLGIDFSTGAQEKQQLRPENFLCWDLTQPLQDPVVKDVVVSLEVYEHIMPQHEDAYVDNLLSFDPRLLILSCAPPGQWGRGHSNPCTQEHVISKLATRGYVPDEELTAKFRKIPKIATFYRKNTVVFKKESK